jgi:hypothetical protein
MNKPVGSTNIVTIDNLDGDGFWLIKEEETHTYVYCTEPDFNMSNSDMESDINNKASCTELTSAEDEQALDPFGSDDQLVSEGEDWNTEEEANVATLEEEDAPCSKAHPIPHHTLHVPIISHTTASSGEPYKKGHTFQIVTMHGEHITERQNQTLLELFWVLWHIIWVWLLKPLWGMALQLITLSKQAFKVLYWTSPVKGNIQCVQASLLEGEGMRMPSISSEQTAALATPLTFITLKLQAMPSKATAAAAQPAWTVCFHKPLHV